MAAKTGPPRLILAAIIGPGDQFGCQNRSPGPIWGGPLLATKTGPPRLILAAIIGPGGGGGGGGTSLAAKIGPLDQFGGGGGGPILA